VVDLRVSFWCKTFQKLALKIATMSFLKKLKCNRKMNVNTKYKYRKR